MVCHGVPRCTRPNAPTEENLLVGKSQSLELRIFASITCTLPWRSVLLWSPSAGGSHRAYSFALIHETAPLVFPNSEAYSNRSDERLADTGEPLASTRESRRKSASM